MPSDTPPPHEESPPPAEEEPRRLPIGCHPLVFGVVAATLQMAAILVLMRGCG